MIKEGILKVGNIFFVHCQPLEESYVSIVEKIDYPIFFSKKNFIYSKNKNSIEISINLKENIALTILTTQKIKEVFEGDVRKKIKKAKKEFNKKKEEYDIFGA